MTLLLLTDDRMLDHDAGRGHPESPQRLRAAREALVDLNNIEWRAPAAARREQLLRVHTAGYIDFIDGIRRRSVRLDPDTVTSSDSVAAAYLAAGAAIEASRAVVQGEFTAAFALVRPPGHHAEADRAMGFCLFNNIAVAAAHAIAELGCERVLIVDWDVHHGNGTQHIFESRRDVLYFSAHQYPFYPGTGAAEEIGADEGAGFTINVPLPAGCGDDDFISAFERLLVPIADAYRPDLVLVSAGFDAHEGDPLAEMAMTRPGYARLCAIALAIATRHCDGRLALLLEGGYRFDALGACVRACAEVLGGGSVPDHERPAATPHSAAARVIEHIRVIHSRFWPALRESNH